MASGEVDGEDVKSLVDAGYLIRLGRVNHEVLSMVTHFNRSLKSNASFRGTTYDIASHEVFGYFGRPS